MSIQKHAQKFRIPVAGFLLIAILLFGAYSTAENVKITSLRSALRGTGQPVETLQLSQQSGEIAYGQSLQLSLVGDTEGVGRVFWKSANESLLCVERDGYLRCVGTPTDDTPVAITAEVLTWDGKTKTAVGSFTVKGGTPRTDLKAPDISLTHVFLREDLYLYPGERYTVAPTLPAGSRVTNFSSSNEGVAAVAGDSNVRAIAPGEALLTLEVTGTDGQPQRKQLRVTVLPPYAPSGGGLQLSVSDITLWPGETLFPAYTLPSGVVDEVTWKSDNPKVASVSPDGVITAVSMGETLVHLSTRSGSDSTAVWVRVPGIEPTLEKLSLKKGETYNLSVLVQPEDLSNVTLAAVANHPEAVSVNDMKVSALSGTASEVEVTVLAATQDGLVMRTVQLTIEAEKTVARSSSGSAAPKATPSPSPAPPALTVYPENAVIQVGEKLAISSRVTPSTADQSVVYVSSAPSIATVDTSGVVTGIAVGNATIEVRTRTGNSVAKCTVQVVQTVATSIKLIPDVLTMNAGAQATLRTSVLPDPLAGKSVTYSSSDSSIVSIDQQNSDNSGVVIRALKKGTAKITATVTPGGLKAETVVTVNALVEKIEIISPTVIRLSVGESSSALSVLVTPSDAKQTLHYELNPSTNVNEYGKQIASVNATTGVVTGMNPGTTTLGVFATDGSGKAATVQVIVYQKLVTGITADTPVTLYKLAPNQTVDGFAVLPAGVALADQAVTVEYSNAGIATCILDTNGVPSRWIAWDVGTTYVTFTSKQDPRISCTIKVTVEYDTPESITIDINSLKSSYTAGIPGEHPKLTAVGKHGGMVDLVALNQNAVWSSSDTSVAYFTTPQNGIFMPKGKGNATITATVSGCTATAAVVVEWAPIKRIVLSTYSLKLMLGEAGSTITARAEGDSGTINPQAGGDIQFSIDETYYEVTRTSVSGTSCTVSIRAIKGGSNPPVEHTETCKAFISANGQNAESSPFTLTTIWNTSQAVVVNTDKAELILNGESQTFTASWAKNDGSNPENFTWTISSGNAQFVSDGTGSTVTVKGIGIGGATLTVTGTPISGIMPLPTKTIALTVVYAPPLSIQITAAPDNTHSFIAGTVGAISQLTAIVNASGQGTANQAVIWSVNQPTDCVTLNQDGTIKFLKPGIVIVTATSKVDSSIVATYTFFVTADTIKLTPIGDLNTPFAVGETRYFELNVTAANGGYIPNNIGIYMENNNHFVFERTSDINKFIWKVTATDISSEGVSVDLYARVTYPPSNTTETLPVGTASSKWADVELRITPATLDLLVGESKPVSASWVLKAPHPAGAKIDTLEQLALNASWAVAPSSTATIDVNAAQNVGYVRGTGVLGSETSGTVTLTATASYHGQTITSSNQCTVKVDKVMPTSIAATASAYSMIIGRDNSVELQATLQYTGPGWLDPATPVEWVCNPSAYVDATALQNGKIVLSTTGENAARTGTVTLTITAKVGSVTSNTVTITYRYDDPDVRSISVQPTADYVSAGTMVSVTIEVAAMNGGTLNPTLTAAAPVQASNGSTSVYSIFSAFAYAQPYFTASATAISAKLLPLGQLPPEYSVTLQDSAGFSKTVRFTLPKIAPTSLFSIATLSATVSDAEIISGESAEVFAMLSQSTNEPIPDEVEIRYRTETPATVFVDATSGVITALQPGEAVVYATATLGDETIESAPLEITVFYDEMVLEVPSEPIMARPGDTQIGVGAQMHSRSGGQPNPNAVITYESSDPAYISVDTDGYVSITEDCPAGAFTITITGIIDDGSGLIQSFGSTARSILVERQDFQANTLPDVEGTSAFSANAFPGRTDAPETPSAAGTEPQVSSNSASSYWNTYTGESNAGAMDTQQYWNNDSGAQDTTSYWGTQGTTNDTFAPSDGESNWSSGGWGTSWGW